MTCRGALESFRHSAELGFDPQPGLALLRLDERKPTVARRAISQALADENGLAREGRWLVLPAAVEIAIAAGDAELARSALEELEELAESLDTTAVHAAAIVASGRLALSESRTDDAIRELRRGVRMWSEIDVPYETAQARELLAGAYADLGDQDAAELELTAARASFERIGAERAAHHAGALLSRAGTVQHTAVRTFMFTDIVDSTRLVEMLGDEQWESLLAWHDRTLRGCFEARAGEEVKHEGDGFFIAFAESASALECACSIQRSLRDHRRDHGFAPRVRIGIHAAEATDRGGDYGGRGVHTTARIAAAAGPGEIIASRDGARSGQLPLPRLRRATARVEGTRGSSHGGYRRLVGRLVHACTRTQAHLLRRPDVHPASAGVCLLSADSEPLADERSHESERLALDERYGDISAASATVLSGRSASSAELVCMGAPRV